MSDREHNRPRKICIACGGSAGHIFPGLTLGEELIKHHGNDVEVLFLTSENMLGEAILKKSRFNFYTLPLRGSTKGSALKTLDFILSLFKSYLKSMKIISSNRPDCFVGFGSYIAGPPFAAALMLKVPTLIHEQNAVMGKANRIMQYFATRVALSFFEKSPELKKSNRIVTGNPIRESTARIQDRASAIDFLGMSHEKFTILVIGGSQGSMKINSMVIYMFKNMEKQLRDRIQVIHISGEGDYKRLKNEYRSVNISYKLYPFFADMGILYSAADISIGRAGASVIFELCAHKIPSILIPYPFAEGHQLQNASFLAEKGAAIVIEEGKASKDALHSTVIKLMKEDGLRKSMSKSLENLAIPDAAKRLADEVGRLAGL